MCHVLLSSGAQMPGFRHAICVDSFYSLFMLVIVTAKSGVEPSDCVSLARHVKQNCPNLKLAGLMTIGMPDYTSTPENFEVR